MTLKLLAIIPSKNKSIGIPNKNIRILGDHPLIYYPIKNAKKSKYISEIIVATDCKEVSTIATQMGVSSIEVDLNDLDDKTTYDELIYKLTQDVDYDYVISMQSSSPLLKVDTIDKAIEYFIKHDLDTLISVKKIQNLSWKIIDGKICANDEKRENSQYLQPQYFETGGFIISKKEAVKSDSRIGNKVDLFELSNEEAITIRTFEDLSLANVLMQKKSVGIYVNGNNTRGIGHIYRALELADLFYSKPDIYFDSNQTEIEVFGETNHTLIPINGINELLIKLENKEYDIFINDILNTNIDYMIALRNCMPQAKIVNFEDSGEGIYKADLVFNALYQETSIPHIKGGEEYYIASKLFMFYEPVEIKEHVENVFISFGGADPQNYSDRLLNIIKDKEYENITFYVVLGRAKLNVDKLLEYNKYNHIHVLYDVTDMPEIMSKCDVAITSRGRTGYELAILGIPTIAMAQNKREEKHGFVNNENGFNYLGLNPSDHIIKSNLDLFINLTKEERMKYQETLLKTDLRNGRKRVLNLIRNLF